MWWWGESFGVVVGAFSCAGMEGGVLLLGLFSPRTQTENRGTPLSTISAGALWIGYNVLDGLVRRIAADQPHAGTRARRDEALRDRFNPSLSRPSSTRPSNALNSEPSRAVFFTFSITHRIKPHGPYTPKCEEPANPPRSFKSVELQTVAVLVRTYLLIGGSEA